MQYLKSIAFSVFLIFMMSISILLSTSVFSVANAHQDASDPEFCARGKIKTVSTVKISGESLTSMVRSGTVNCPVGIINPNPGRIENPEARGELTIDERLSDYVGEVLSYRNAYYRHDFFDHSAARLAYSLATCHCASTVNREINTSQMRPLLEGPELLTSENHHSDYELSGGVSFSCNVCELD